jgi:hypothetical protein
MATLSDIEAQLPNGFHDMYLEQLSVDFERRVAVFDLELWVGEVSSKNHEAREATRRGQLVLEGLQYCVLDPPDPASPYTEATAAWVVDICEPDPALTGPRPLPPDAFAARFIVNQWNAFIHVAATHAGLRWTDGAA